MAGVHYTNRDLGVVSIAEFGAVSVVDSPGFDSSNAIQAAIDSIESKVDINNGIGGTVVFPEGRYKITKPIVIKKSNVTLKGANMRGVQILPQIVNESYAFVIDSGTGTKITSIEIENIMIDGTNGTCSGIFMKDVMIARFENVFIDKMKGNGLYLEEVYDSVFENCVFRGSGNVAKNQHAVYIFNGVRDNSNRLIFNSCHFEANLGSHVYSDSSGNARLNGQNQFISCKFHGYDPSALPGNNPLTPAILLHGDNNFIDNCMFFQTNGVFVKIIGTANKVSASAMYNCTDSAVSIQGDRNIVTTTTIQYTGSGKGAVNVISGSDNSVNILGSGWTRPIDDTGTDTIAIYNAGGFTMNTKNINLLGKGDVEIAGQNFRISNKDSKLMSYGRNHVGDDGGRLALWSNMYRTGSSKKQPLGSKPSFSVTVADNAGDGVQITGAPATGVDESNITPQVIAKATLDTFQSYVPFRPQVVNALPTADATNRGAMVHLQDATGYLDGIYVSTKTNNGYEWTLYDNNASYTTPNTGASLAGQWTKVASLNVTKQYGSSATVLKLSSMEGNSAKGQSGTVKIKVKQQAAMGGAPFIELVLLDQNGMSAEDVTTVTSSNSTTLTTVDVYVKTLLVYDMLSFKPLLTRSVNGYVTMTPGSALVATLPAGTATVATSSETAIPKITSLPTPTASYRGKVLNVEGGTGAADAVYVCKKLADESYDWVQIG